MHIRDFMPDFTGRHLRQFEREQSRWSPRLSPSAPCFGFGIWLAQVFRRNDSESESIPH